MTPVPRIHKTHLLTFIVIFFQVLSMSSYSQEIFPKTRAESSNYEETSRYEDVLAFITELQQQTNLLRVETFGKTEEGRELPLLIISNPPLVTARAAHASGKTVVFIQANIHAGEVEGKEAVLQLARRLVAGDLKSVLNKLVVLIAPIYNADGNEKISTDHRPEQYGPIGGVGTRENGKKLDLNRDYMKIESVEAKALIGLFNRWDPHLIVDLHTTNGSYHGYHLTYAPMLNPNSDSHLIAFQRKVMLPSITQAMLKRHYFRTYYYGNFATKDAMNYEVENFTHKEDGKEKVWRTFDHRPRFGNNYAGLRNRLTILSEAYSYLDFHGRIQATESFVEEILKFCNINSDSITTLIKRVDEDTIKRGLNGGHAEMGVEFEIKSTLKPVEILVGEVEKITNPRSGKEMTKMIEANFTAHSLRSEMLASLMRTSSEMSRTFKPSSKN
jgi:Zinc carboxypeptidase